MVADAAEPPIDKACGEGLMPDSLEALRQLGVALDPEQSFSFRGIRFIGDGGAAAADFPREHGIAVRRIRLHQALIDRAQEAGCEALVANSRDGVSTTCAPAGSSAPMARTRAFVGGPISMTHAANRSRYGFRRHYRVRPWTDFVEVYWGPGCQMYVTGVAHDEMLIGLLTRDPHMRLNDALPRFPDLARKLAGAATSARSAGRSLSCVVCAGSIAGASR